MASEDTEIFSRRLRVENKVLFVDLRRNATGTYLKLSERRGDKRNSIIIPARGIEELRETLAEAQETISPAASRPASVAAGPAESAASSATGPIAGPTLVRVGNLSYDTSDANLANHFKSAGAVVRTQLLLRSTRAGQVSSGRAIVEFSTPAAAAKAVQTLNKSTLDGRPIVVYQTRRDVGGSSPPPSVDARSVTSKKIYVRNLSWETTEDDLEAFFGRIGEVKSTSVRKTRAGRSLGQGIVEFADVHAAAEAVERLNNAELDGRAITLRPFFEATA